ncbi:MAG: hypothetical protein ACLFWD_04160 [Anaerolineales bacterium]
MRLFQPIFHYTGRLLLLLLMLVVLAGGTLRVEGTRSEVRRHTRPLEFDFMQWTMNALVVKFGQYGLNSAGYLDSRSQIATVERFLELQELEKQLENELFDLYAEPALENRDQFIEAKSVELAAVEADRRALQPTAEAVLQEQTALVLADQGFSIGGKNVPPVSFHFTELPYALIVSPRDVIRQAANIQLETDLSLENRVELEEQVAESLDVSALVVPVGGYGTYPTMVQQMGNLTWVAEVVVHEWIHNYLTLRPLGLRYHVTSELRTMNETTAELLGKTWGRILLERYYPDRVPPEMPPAERQEAASEPEPPTFDFREEMRVTREQVDELLAEGEIEAAEAYMEARRLVFWEHGYRIRKLNQAYFAFHGSYAAEPGGAAGDDPVGEAVRELWAQVGHPAEFLRTMSWMTSPEDLEEALGRPIQLD